MRLSPLVDGVHQAPSEVTEAMHPEYVGTTPFIAPDEDFLLFASSTLDGGQGKMDLYVGFRRGDGSWPRPINLGPAVNGPDHELCPILSPDGRFLFFISRSGRPESDVLWMRAEFLDELRPGRAGARETS